MYGKRLVPLLLLAALTATPPPGAGQPPKPPVLPPVAPNLARPDQTFQGLDGPGFAIAAGDAAYRVAAACSASALAAGPPTSCAAMTGRSPGWPLSLPGSVTILCSTRA